VFGVIVGLNLFGFLGLIFGPLLLSLFLLLVRVYKDEFGLVTAADANETEG
jgi:predicted PurR-regulated permease PerM